MLSFSSNILTLGLVVCGITSIFSQDSSNPSTSEQKAAAFTAGTKQEHFLTGKPRQRIQFFAQL